jgi:hypothetical protein
MNFYSVGEILFPVKWVVQSSKRSAAPGWQTGSGSRPDEIDLLSGSPLGRTSRSHDPPDGCHVGLEPLHEPLERARINKKE